MSKPILLVFGNCQAEALATSFQHYPGIAGNYETLYLASYNITPEARQAFLTPERLQNTQILLEQVTPHVSLSNHFNFDNARITSFPAVDFNLLWPLRADETRLMPEPPDFPWGRFPYGDKIINQVVKQGLTGDEAWERFVALSRAALPDMSRFAEIEYRRWTAAERLVDVVMSDFIFERYKHERLFWTYNHPHKHVLHRLGARIAHHAGLSPTEEEAHEIFKGLLTFEFGEDFQAPIHPLVGERLQLDWYSPDMQYLRYEQSMDYETFVRAQIAWE